MNSPASHSRRDLLKSTARAAAATSLAAALPVGATASAAAAAAQPGELLQPAGAPKPPADRWRGLKVGVATYSLRGLKLDAVIKGVRRVDLKYVSVKDNHLKLDAPPEQRRAVAEQLRAAGVAPISCGVVTMPNDEAKIRNAFEYARDLGVPVIVCNPDPASFPILDQLVKEFDIKLAIHNHGPEDKRFPSPYDAMKAAEKYDSRIGVCIDVGHTARCNVDPADAIRKCRDRLYDVHMKDVADLAQRGSEIELGRGVLDVRSMFQALIDIRYAHHVGFEHERDATDPLPGLAESVGYAKGIVAGLGNAS